MNQQGMGCRRRRRGILAGGILLSLGCGAALAAPAVDTLVRPAQDQEQARFVLTLPLQHQAELNQLLQQLYTPGDALYHHFLSSAEFDQRFAPTPSQYDTLRSLAAQYGLRVVGEHTSRTVLDVEASTATIRNVFGTRLNLLQQADGLQYFAPDREAAVPFALSAIGAEVAGLNGKPLASHLQVRRAASESEVLAAAQPHAGTQASGSYAPADVKTAYNLNGIQNGGQAVALYELSSANYADAATYASRFGLNNPSLSQVNVDGGTTATNGATEVMLDIEMVMAVSNPTTMYIYTGPNSSTGALDTYAKIASDNLVGQVSTSWGLCESSQGQSGANAENTQFTKMVAQGMALFAAAGDSGAYDCGSGLLGLGGGSVAVDDPASQPKVTGVGGTRLTTTSTQTYTSESVWNTSSTEGGGGGISTFWSIPSYQQSVVFNGPSGQYSSTMRNVPDVALDADPATGFYVYDSVGCGGWCVVGGTSDGSPQWAAFWSLIGKGLANAGHNPARAGFANPLVYPIGENASAYAADFHDVTSGNNNYYNAYTGYDDASGWGSYNGGNLYAAVISSVSGSGSSSSGGSSSSSGSSSGGSSSSSSSGGSSSSSGGSSSGGVSPPAAPTGVTATGTSQGLFTGAVNLSWTASASATSYSIYMGTTAGGESSTPQATTSGTSITIGGLNPQTRYYFKLKASNAAGSSPYSAEVSATTGGL